MFSHNLIFALFSSVAVQREQRKNQEQGNIYKDLSVRSCAESACAQRGGGGGGDVRVTSSACIYQLLWWVRALCALKQCKTGHKRFLFT